MLKLSISRGCPGDIVVNGSDPTILLGFWGGVLGTNPVQAAIDRISLRANCYRSLSESADLLWTRFSARVVIPSCRLRFGWYVEVPTIQR